MLLRRLVGEFGGFWLIIYCGMMVYVVFEVVEKGEGVW